MPFEFTARGLLQRVAALVEHQDFCSSVALWPPIEEAQIQTADIGVSCKDHCARNGLICEPAFFATANRKVAE